MIIYFIVIRNDEFNLIFGCEYKVNIKIYIVWIGIVFINLWMLFG